MFNLKNLNVMKSLINFLLVLLIGIALGYFFHDSIDSKLKSKFGNRKVETVNKTVHKKAHNIYEAVKK